MVKFVRLKTTHRVPVKTSTVGKNGSPDLLGFFCISQKFGTNDAGKDENQST